MGNLKGVCWMGILAALCPSTYALAAFAAARGRPMRADYAYRVFPDLSKKGRVPRSVILWNRYRARFPVRRMNGIAWWNVIGDSGAPGEPSISCLFTRSMEPETVSIAMGELINRRWKTQRSIRAAGFRGGYSHFWKDAKGALREKLVALNSSGLKHEQGGNNETDRIVFTRNLSSLRHGTCR